MATAVLTTSFNSNHKQLTDATNMQQPRALTAEQQPVEKVKRCLFGVPDHQATRNDLSTLLRQLDAQSRQRWNFDFRSGAPLTSLPLSTATSGGARWAWTRVTVEPLPQVTRGTSCQRRSVTQTSSSSPSPRRLLDKPTSTIKRPRMSLTPPVEVKSKGARSEVKFLSCRKSVGGMERRRLLRSTSLLGSPTRMCMSITFIFSR